MLPEKLKKVLSYDVVSITTWTEAGLHVTNTWNSYTETTDDDRILIPAAGMTSTEEDLAVNANLILTAGTREVEGFNGYKGTGFRITGTAAMIEKGEEFDMMKEKYPFLRKVLEVKIKEAKQLL